MKRELRSAIREGINDSNLNGYKWAITPEGLSWSYGEKFFFDLYETEDCGQVLTVRAEQSGITMVTLLIGKAFYHDCSSVEDAFRIAAEATIRRANELY